MEEFIKEPIPQTLIDAVNLLDITLESHISNIEHGKDRTSLIEELETNLKRILTSEDLSEHPYNLSQNYKDLKFSEGQKGLVFPSQMVLNEEIIGFRDSQSVIRSGDLVKVSAAIHLNGHCAFKTMTLLVPNSEYSKKALLVSLSNSLALEITNAFRAGFTNKDVNCFILNTLKQLNEKNKGNEINLVRGVLMHKAVQHIPDANKFIVCPSIEFTVEKKEIKETYEETKDLKPFLLKENDVYEFHFISYFLDDFRKISKGKLLNEKTRNFQEITFLPGKILCRNFDVMHPNVKLKCAGDVLRKIEKSFGGYYFHENELKQIPKSTFGIKALEKSNILRRISNAKMHNGIYCYEIRFLVQVGEKRGSILGKTFNLI